MQSSLDLDCIIFYSLYVIFNVNIYHLFPDLSVDPDVIIFMLFSACGQ